MNRFLPRVLVVAVAATFAVAGCSRDDNRSSRANTPGSATGTAGGTASSPTTPGSTPSPSGGAAPSGSTGASANDGTASPSGTTGGAMSSRAGDDTAGVAGAGGGAPSIPAGGTAAASDGTTAPAGSASGTTSSDTGAVTGGTSGGATSRTGSSGTGSSSSIGTTGTGTATGSPIPPSTPDKSSSLGTHIVGANVQLAADTTTATAGAKLSRSDKEFIEEAASGGLTEVEVGKMMSERATNPGVKQFAEMLVKDHTQANEELRRIATSAGVALPSTPETKHRVMIERLANEKGADLDRTFIRNFGVKEHEKDVKDFQKQADKGENPQLKAFAAKTLPKLQEHLAMAQKLESELGKK